MFGHWYLTGCDEVIQQRTRDGLGATLLRLSLNAAPKWPRLVVGCPATERRARSPDGRPGVAWQATKPWTRDLAFLSPTRSPIPEMNNARNIPTIAS
jgi:hypothetical protein